MIRKFVNDFLDRWHGLCKEQIFLKNHLARTLARDIHSHRLDEIRLDIATKKSLEKERNRSFKRPTQPDSRQLSAKSRGSKR